MYLKIISPSEYEITSAIKEFIRYGGVNIGSNFVVKDNGDCVEVNVDADNDRVVLVLKRKKQVIKPAFMWSE